MLCSVIIHVAALHFGAQNHYRSLVPGAGLDCEIVDSVSIAAGSYRNSVGDRSNYLLAAKDFKLTSSLKAGFFIGGVDGYYWRKQGKFDYFAGLQGSYKVFDRWSLRMQLIPNPTPRSVSVIGLGFSYSFGE